MKRIISLILVAVMLLSFAACGKNEETKRPIETLPLDAEALKADWQNGTLVFPGDKTATFPCTLSEFLKNSGATMNSAKSFEGRMLEPEEKLSFYISVEGANMKITVINTKDEAISYTEAFVAEYSYNNTNETNRQIKFAGTLSPGVSRADVEKALEIPENRTAEDTFYIYEGKNSKGKKVKLNVSFNSDGVVNSVIYEILY